MTAMEWIRRVTSTKYMRALEADVARLRAENRALLNSILGIAGVPPIVVTESDVALVAGLRPAASKSSASASRAPGITATGSRGPQGSATSGTEQKLTPMRRRSWQQIYRMLEINSARKKQDAGEII